MFIHPINKASSEFIGISLKAKQNDLTAQRYQQRSNERNKHLSELQRKNPFEVDSPERAAQRQEFIDPRDGMALERILGKSDLFPISFFEKGLQVSKAICRVEIRDRTGRVEGFGTGFLVTPNLLLTNNHVLPNSDTALSSIGQFNYEIDLNGKERVIHNFRLMPDQFYMTNEELDFTLVAVEEQASDGTKLAEFGYLSLVKQTGKVLIGEYVSIIQHPSGAPKAVVVRENKITDMLDNFIHYSADTLPGSSGSAVFNDEWMVVALHHSGVPDPQNPAEFIANEGVRISSILKYIEDKKPSLTAQQQQYVDRLILSAEGVGPEGESLTVGEELSLVWYEGLTGHDSKFLGDSHEVLHPSFRIDLEPDLVRLKQGGTILHYTHFSIAMSKSRRLAYYTVVNIDGSQLTDYERVDWRYDPRIDRMYQCGNELYKDNPLDRGHLVRRRDPVWGGTGAQANIDSFHFTNCSPQHEKFNQHIWLGLEDYILNHMSNMKRKATVFTGPIFRKDDIWYRNVQIPSEYWKIAVMIDHNDRLSVTAYLTSQWSLIKYLGKAKEEQPVLGAYKTFQVKVSLLETLTGLDFGNLRIYDRLDLKESTFGQVPIERFDDIQLI
ncbi:DNA/RNA non-specific endonuclease [Paenibacillus sp. UMB4589-SE434]|uniref:DNA/RNA non-specific endonuclease n=1 Tax=Paenibacillus sp. UMB4589-SE434 TaxID=3046314 RepID=UPI00254D0BC7|nr:DNA/RNA non-specific endonuclease [Paenibacillus sp. UMB4589-SE434]MDK8180820.1 DNA/RNA non-specific endonuclease [Paenibacillus sp. UMB4589-SE434]